MKNLKIGILVSSDLVPAYINRCIDVLQNFEEIQLTVLKINLPYERKTIREKFANFLFKSPLLLKPENIKLKSQLLTTSEGAKVDFVFSFNKFNSSVGENNTNIFYIQYFSNLTNKFSNFIASKTYYNESNIVISIYNHQGKLMISHRLKTHLHSYAKTFQLVLNDVPNLISDFIKRHDTNLIKSNFDDASLEIDNPIPLVSTYLKQIKNVLFHRYKNLFGSTIWNVGNINMPISEFVFNANSKVEIDWLEHSKGQNFQADPFGVFDANEEYILYEYYDSKKKKGIIKIKSSIHDKSDQIILETPYHLSYPFLFQFEDEWYCIPEQCQSNQLDLYKLDKSSRKLTFCKTIINEIAAVDPTILFYQDRWWLFCTDSNNKGADLRLNIYFANNPLDNWFPHSLNPVKTDISSARPAGTPFFYNGKLIRPSQNSSKSYGGSIIINEIVKLTTTEFLEIKLKQLNPNIFEGSYPDGIHTISSFGNCTLIDGKRIEYKFKHFLNRLLR